MQTKGSSRGGRNNGLDVGGRLHKARIRLQETNWVRRGGKKAGLGKTTNMSSLQDRKSVPLA